MSNRLTITDAFGAPVHEGEALMAAVVYHPYEGTTDFAKMIVRGPFFKATTDEYGRLIFKDTDAFKQGFERSLLLDCPGFAKIGSDPYACLAGLGREELRIFEMDFDDRAYKGYIAGKTGSVPVLPTREEVPSEDTSEADELAHVTSCAGSMRVLKLNGFIYHLKGEGADKTSAEGLQALLGEAFEVVPVRGGLAPSTAYLVIAKHGPAEVRREGRRGDELHHTYMTHWRYEVDHLARNAEREKRQAAGYRSSVIVVRKTTFDEILASARPEHYGFLEGKTRADLEQWCKTYLKEFAKKADAITPDRSSLLGLACWELSPSRPGMRDDYMEAIMREYAGTSVHLAANPFVVALSLYGAGVPLDKIVKQLVDGYEFLSVVTCNGLNLIDARRVKGYFQMEEGMAGILSRNLNRTVNYGKKAF